MDVIEQAQWGLLMHYRDSHTHSSHRQRPPQFPKRHPKPKKPRESRKAKKERLANLATQPVPILFQRNPFLKNNSFFIAKSYTENVETFCETGKKRRTAIIRNLRMTGRHISHMVTINLYDEHHPAIINHHFSRFIKALSSHDLIGHWTIEVNWDNRLHWHLLFLDWCGKPLQLKQLVGRLLHEVQFPRFRVRAERKKPGRDLIGYCLKVRKAGYKLFEKEPDALGVKTFSRSVPDIYADKRILFVRGTGLDKHGVFGKFWAEGWNEKRFWKQVQEESARIADNMKDPRVRDLVHHMRHVLGISLKAAKWKFALDPYMPQYDTLESSQRPLRDVCGRPPKTTLHSHARQRLASSLLLSLFKGKTGARRASDRPRRLKARQSVPMPIRSEEEESPCCSCPWFTRSDIRLPFPRSP